MVKINPKMIQIYFGEFKENISAGTINTKNWLGIDPYYRESG